MKRVALVSLLSSLSVLVACEDRGVNCDLMLVSAVNVSVVDVDGLPVEGASVFADDGEREVECPSAEAGAFNCYDVGGELLIRVEAEGYQGLEEAVFVEVGPCHPVTESLDVELAEITR